MILWGFPLFFLFGKKFANSAPEGEGVWFANIQFQLSFKIPFYGYSET